MIRLAVLATAALLAAGSPVPVPTVGAQAATGELLAVVGRQVARVNLALSRPIVLTSVPLPANAVDVAALPGDGRAVVAVTRPTHSGIHAGELFLLDAAGGLAELAPRLLPSESLTAPAWWPDGSGVLFQREDVE